MDWVRITFLRLAEVKEQLQNHKIKNHLDLDLYTVGTILGFYNGAGRAQCK